MRPLKPFHSQFDRSRLPDPQAYFEGQGLKLLERRGTWRTTRCEFHQGSDSMRLNVKTGAWVCMNCGARGGDVLAYHMASQGLDFIDAAKALGAWSEDGVPGPTRSAQFSARDALSVLRLEARLCAVAAGNIARDVGLSDDDRARLLKAASRIEYVGAMIR